MAMLVIKRGYTKSACQTPAQEIEEALSQGRVPSHRSCIQLARSKRVDEIT